MSTNRLATTTRTEPTSTTVLRTPRSIGVLESDREQPASSVGRTPVASRELPGDPGRSLTAIVVELPPGIKVGSHQHAGTVFAYVVEGSVRSQLNDGEVVEYKTGQSWMEPPGTTHSLTENPSPSAPARLLAVFVAPTGAQLTTPGR